MSHALSLSPPLLAMGAIHVATAFHTTCELVVSRRTAEQWSDKNRINGYMDGYLSFLKGDKTGPRPVERPKA